MSSSGVVSKKLKFKGDKPKKKKRSHREAEDGGTDELAAMAAAEPKGESVHCCNECYTDSQGGSSRRARLKSAVRLSSYSPPHHRRVWL
jgi:hypothetical protein